jgi:hypothetical protein
LVCYDDEEAFQLFIVAYKVERPAFDTISHLYNYRRKYSDQIQKQDLKEDFISLDSHLIIKYISE